MLQKCYHRFFLFFVVFDVWLSLVITPLTSVINYVFCSITTNTNIKINLELWNCRGPPLPLGAPRHETQQPPHRYATEFNQGVLLLYRTPWFNELLARDNSLGAWQTSRDWKTTSQWYYMCRHKLWVVLQTVKQARTRISSSYWNICHAYWKTHAAVAQLNYTTRRCGCSAAYWPPHRIISSTWLPSRVKYEKQATGGNLLDIGDLLETRLTDAIRRCNERRFTQLQEESQRFVGVYS